jgi:dihydrofolate reductase
MYYNLIVAMCEGIGIGYKGQIPWHNKADLKHFSNITKGKCNNAVVMGKITWNSLPNKMLPLRDNLILSSTIDLDATIKADRIKTFENSDAVIQYCNLMNYDEVWIIGGASLYKQFLDLHLVNKCYITTIDNHYECDTFFPELSSDEWVLNNTFSLSDETSVSVFDYAS